MSDFIILHEVNDGNEIYINKNNLSAFTKNGEFIRVFISSYNISYYQVKESTEEIYDMIRTEKSTRSATDDFILATSLNGDKAAIRRDAIACIIETEDGAVLICRDIPSILVKEPFAEVCRLAGIKTIRNKRR